jgi:HK97 family phage prohead protease
MGLPRWLAWLGRGGELTTFSAESVPRPIDQLFAEMREATGRVTRDQALSVPAVQKGRNLICAIATLPLRQLDSSNRVVPSALLEQIDLDVPNIVTLAQTLEDLVFESIAWWRITGFEPDGFPMTARRLDPDTVSLDPPAGRSPAPLPSGGDPRGAVVWVDGKEVPASQVIRFDSPNPAVLTAGGRAIRRALALDKAAKMYADDPRPQDYFTPTDGADPADDDEIEDILDKWKQVRRKRSTGYVPAALKYNAVDSPSPADLQLVQLQQQAALDIANAFGVDPEDLGISTTSRTYANAVDRRRDRINDVLAPYMRAITDRLSMGDVTRKGRRVVFNLDDYLKSNPTERWNVYKTAKELGAVSVDEIREMEGLPPGAPERTPSPAGVDASRSSSLRFDAPKSHQFTFALEAEHEFAVDAEKRTITGLAVPYGKIGVKYGVKYRFRKDSLQYKETSRVKHFKDHVTPVGKALDLKDTRSGLVAKLSVGHGPTGDELLQLADDGVYDGLSVGVDFNLDPDAGDVVLARDGVYDVIRADLREISTTAMPAFDDARVTKVAASRDGGNAMPCTSCGQEHAPGVACPTQTPPAVQLDANPAGLTLSADQLMALLGNRISVPVQQSTEQEPEQRQVVNPTRLTASTVVTEPAPYRLDGRGNLRMGSHDFSQDLFAFAQQGDSAAHDRAMDFVRKQFDVATTDVNELNPNRQRPDMYVDQKNFRYPVWEAIDKGTLTDITPFTFPKFSSASGLVGAHTEGNEPTSGTLVTTSQTVTPSALSGKAKITRETWDQGGNPQVSNLIWRQILKGWYEGLEAAAVALLDAASPTQIDLSGTPGLADEGLDQAITSAFAALQFVRGGFSMDNMFTQIDLYKALVAATDADGRRLYPALGPANANGTVRSRWAALDINGVTALPAWALAATGSVAASSYLFDSADVHGWASVPQRLDFNIEVAHVYIGVWGYKATAISDITGVREVVYDPS